MYFLGLIATFIGAVWMAFNAFNKDGALAGILCFVCGFYTIYYGIRNFAENKVPFLLFLAGVALAVIYRPDTAALAGAY